MLITINVLVRAHDGLCATGTRTYQVVGGRLVHPMAPEQLDRISPDAIYCIEPSGPIRGWGRLDCERAWRIGRPGEVAGAIVPDSAMRMLHQRYGITYPTKPTLANAGD